jgi:transcriptional regulator with XRE-family HTH domain
MTNNLEEKNLSQILKEVREKSGLSLNEFSQKLRVSKWIIQDLENGEFKKLPADSYILSILKKYCEHFNFDFDFLKELWFKSKNNFSKNDFLPQNRFKTPNSLNIKVHPAIIIFIIVFIVLAIQVFNFIKTPEIILENVPNVATSSVLNLTGYVSGEIKNLVINGEKMNLEDNNKFSYELVLKPGINLLNLKATNFINKENSLTTEIIYQSR